MVEIMLFVSIIFLACTFQAAIGFGSALLATPLALLFFPKETVICSMVLLGIPLNLYLAWKIKAKIDMRLTALLVGASLLGMPFGVYILKLMPLAMMKLAVCLLSMIFTIALLWDRLKLSVSTVTNFIAGFLGGLLTTSVSMNGPPVVLLLSGQKMPKDQFRKITAIFFGTAALVGTALFFFSGVLHWDNISGSR